MTEKKQSFSDSRQANERRSKQKNKKKTKLGQRISQTRLNNTLIAYSTAFIHFIQQYITHVYRLNTKTMHRTPRTVAMAAAAA